MRRGISAAVLCAMAGTASAYGLAPSRITVRADASEARIAVTFNVEVFDPGSFAMEVDRPSRSVVIAASVTDAEGTHRMTLTRAEAADDARATLAQAPAAKRMATMVLVGDSMSLISIEGLAHRRGVMSVELELSGPTCFDHDTRYVALPTEWVDALTAAAQRQVVDTERAQELSSRCDRNADAKTITWLGVPDRKLARRPAGENRIGATASRFSDGTQQAARLELSIASTLSAIPGDLHTAFVVDTSRSMTSDQRDAARALIRSYLAHAPRSSVQVIGYARTASPLLAGWMTADKAAPAIDERLTKTKHRNGSELQGGLHEAGAWLARARGTRRVVILSDERVADRVGKISAATLAKELPPGTLVHVVALSSANGLVRNDEGRWAALASATEGIAMTGGTDGNDVLEALSLVRPTSLDHVRITAPTWSPLEGPETSCESADSLVEGQACTWWGQAEAGDSLALDGLLWGRRWHTVVPLGERANITLARQLRFVLEPAEDLAVAALDAAKAVSERWSLVARWGGTGGYAETGGGGTGWGTMCGCDGFGTIGHGSGTGSGFRFSVSLRTQLFEVVGRCTPDGVAIALTVETTRDEIVDVSATASLRGSKGAPSDAKAIETCVVEAVWNTNIQFTDPREHATAQLTF